MAYLTVERKPLEFQDNNLDQHLTITNIEIATKNGSEIRTSSDMMCNPQADCWFCITIRYIWRRSFTTTKARTTKSDGKEMHDTIITNGSEAYLCTRDLGPTRLIFNNHSRARIETAIATFIAENFS